MISRYKIQILFVDLKKSLSIRHQIVIKWRIIVSHAFIIDFFIRRPFVIVFERVLLISESKKNYFITNMYHIMVTI